MVALGVRIDAATGLAAVSLTGLTGRVPGYEPDDRPIDLFRPVDRPPRTWQAPLVIHFADPESGRLRRRYLGFPIDLKRLGLTDVLAELDRWRVRLTQHERVVSPPAKSLRGRLVALVPQSRPAALAVVYLATRIQPFRAFGEGSGLGAAPPDGRQPPGDDTGQERSQTGGHDQRQRRPGRAADQLHQAPHGRGRDRERRDREHPNAHHPPADIDRRAGHEHGGQGRHAGRGRGADQAQERQRHPK